MNPTETETDKDLIQISDIKDVQAILLFMLKRFHELCIRNNLVYNVFGGTMLGAVRHQGFIPWDDDIDITMPLQDYELLDSFLENDKDLEVYNFDKEHYPYFFKKICLKDSLLIEEKVSPKYNKSKIYLDVFPAVPYPVSDVVFARLNFINRLRIEAARNPLSYGSSFEKLIRPLRCLVDLLLGSFNIRNIIKKEYFILTQFGKRSTTDFLLYGAGWGKRGIISSKTYYDRLLYKFEDMQVYGIRHYKDHLKRLYGDYQTLPPEDKRQPNHNNRLFVTHNIYKKIFSESLK